MRKVFLVSVMILTGLLMVGCGGAADKDAEPPPDMGDGGDASEPPDNGGETGAEPPDNGGGTRNGDENGGGDTANGDDPEYAIVRAFYATDRNYTGSAKPKDKYGSDRSDLSYGVCEVSIPRDHRMGELEEPFSFLGISLPENPEKHVVLLSGDRLPKHAFYQQLKQRIQGSQKKSAFVFVHGYNVTFEDAARRTGQMTYDLGFDGAPVFYSWPSKGKTSRYTHDEATIQWSTTGMKEFLDDFVSQSTAENIYLIAHSMGNRGLTRALAYVLDENPSAKHKIKEVILTAPDIDADVFIQEIAPAIVSDTYAVTLYASSEDVALKASKAVHGAPRAGDSGDGLVIVDGIETIDAANVDTSFLGHSYFAEASVVLSDIFHVINTDKRADQRFGLRGVNTDTGRYWEFKE